MALAAWGHSVGPVALFTVLDLFQASGGLKHAKRCEEAKQDLLYQAI